MTLGPGTVCASEAQILALLLEADLVVQGGLLTLVAMSVACFALGG